MNTSTQRPTIPTTRAFARWQIAKMLDEYIANGGLVRRFAANDTNVIWTLNDFGEDAALYRNVI
jgi:hypothetical protein